MLHARTYRYKGQCRVDPASYRNPEELKRAMQHDALELAQRRLSQQGVTANQLERIATAARDEVATAVESARRADWPTTAVAFADVQSTGAMRWL